MMVRALLQQARYYMYIFRGRNLIPLTAVLDIHRVDAFALALFLNLVHAQKKLTDE